MQKLSDSSATSMVSLGSSVVVGVWCAIVLTDGITSSLTLYGDLFDRNLTRPVPNGSDAFSKNDTSRVVKLYNISTRNTTDDDVSEDVSLTLVGNASYADGLKPTRVFSPEVRCDENCMRTLERVADTATGETATVSVTMREVRTIQSQMKWKLRAELRALDTALDKLHRNTLTRRQVRNCITSLTKAKSKLNSYLQAIDTLLTD